jgi:hypothetical protein
MVTGASPVTCSSGVQQRSTAGYLTRALGKWRRESGEPAAHQECIGELGEDRRGRNQRRFDAELRPETKRNGWFQTMETFPSRFLPPRGPRHRGGASRIPSGSSGDLNRWRGSSDGARVLEHDGHRWFEEDWGTEGLFLAAVHLFIGSRGRRPSSWASRSSGGSGVRQPSTELFPCSRKMTTEGVFGPGCLLG